MFSFVKETWEETTRAIDFSGLREIQAGELIASAEVIVFLNKVEQSDMLIGSAVVQNRVLFRVRGGLDGEDYRVVVRVITDAQHRRVGKVTIHVRDG